MVEAIELSTSAAIPSVAAPATLVPPEGNGDLNVSVTNSAQLAPFEAETDLRTRIARDEGAKDGAELSAEEPATNGRTPTPPTDEEQSKLDLVGETYNVMSTSTAHGVWRIFDRQRPMWNRLCWATLWLLSFSLFVGYLVLQSQYLMSSPTSTLITEEFVTPMVFPAVSVCLSTIVPDSIKAFIKLNPGNNIREQLESLFNTSGILCYYTMRNVRQLWNLEYTDETKDCRVHSRLEWIDYPFATSPTLCLSTGNQTLESQSAGSQILLIGKLPNLDTFDSITYSIKRTEDQFQPLLANFLTLGLQTRVRFSTSYTTSIKECDDRPGGQPKCMSDFQQRCVERVCNCTYPVITDPIASDLAEQLPGSCAAKHRLGLCNYDKNIFPCAPGNPKIKVANVCNLNDLCGSARALEACPLPSCEQTGFPQVASSRPLSSGVLNGTGLNSSGAEGIFILQAVLNSQTVTYIREESAYTPLMYFGAVGGMMGLLLGFSMLTIMEWIEGCFKIGRKVQHVAAEEVVELLRLKEDKARQDDVDGARRRVKTI